MANSPSLEELLRRLTPVIQAIVTTTVQEAIGQVVSVEVVPGLVTQVDGETAHVRTDDGGLEGSPTPGIVSATRLGSGITVGSRVLVLFFPKAGAVVCLSVTGT